MIKSHKSKVSLPYIMLHTFAYLVSALGLCAMYVHKETGKPEGSAYYDGHLYSIHSWAGVLAAAMFTIQWLTAAATFIMPCLLKIGLPLGKMFSLYTTIVSTISVISGVNQHAMKTLWVWWRTIITGGLEIWVCLIFYLGLLIRNSRILYCFYNPTALVSISLFVTMPTVPELEQVPP